MNAVVVRECLCVVNAQIEQDSKYFRVIRLFSSASFPDRKDRMSMYSGLEVRVPYCDYRIAEYLYSVPWAMKYEDGVEKSLLRKAMADVLPPEVLWRKKSPYPKTHHPAYEAAVSKLLEELLEREDAPIFSLIKKDSLQRLLTDRQPWPWYGQLMTRPQTIAYFLQLDYWLQKYKVRLVL